MDSERSERHKERRREQHKEPALGLGKARSCRCIPDAGRSLQVGWSSLQLVRR